jgi:hypothetical protein
MILGDKALIFEVVLSHLCVSCLELFSFLLSVEMQLSIKTKMPVPLKWRQLNQGNIKLCGWLYSSHHQLLIRMTNMYLTVYIEKDRPGATTEYIALAASTF